MLKAFCTWIEDNVSGVTIGTNFYAGFRPKDAPDNCTVAIHNGGVDNVDPVDQDFVLHRVQLLTRNNAYHAGFAEAKRIFRALVSLDTLNVEMSAEDSGSASETYKLNSVQGAFPKHIGQDAKGRYEFSTNLVVTTTEES